MSDLTMKMLAKWSIDEYHRMAEAGILRDRNVELLEGEIIEIEKIIILFSGKKK